MKFCLCHWDNLREAIKGRGLWHLVAKDGETAIENLTAELSGQGSLKTYDPLMDAHMMISSRALQAGGLYLLAGDLCPLCELVSHTHEEAAQEWIDGCTDAVLKHCQKEGLTSLPQ